MNRREIRKRIAKIMGWEWCDRHECPVDKQDVLKYPECRWDDVMEVAIKTGLFDFGKHSCVMQFERKSWSISDDIEEYANHESGPTAICLAIIKLSTPQTAEEAWDLYYSKEIICEVPDKSSFLAGWKAKEESET